MLFFWFLSFLPLQLHRHAVVVVNFISTLIRFALVIAGPLIMTSSLLSKDNTVSNGPAILSSNLLKRNISLSTVGDNYSFTRAHNVLALLISSIDSLESPSYWYNISDNGMGSLCELFLLQDCVFIYNKNMWYNPTKES